jgi:hypothetical protein
MRNPPAARELAASIGWLPSGIAFLKGGYGTPIDCLSLASIAPPVVGNGKVNPVRKCQHKHAGLKERILLAYEIRQNRRHSVVEHAWPCPVDSANMDPHSIQW